MIRVRHLAHRGENGAAVSRYNRSMRMLLPTRIAILAVAALLSAIVGLAAPAQARIIGTDLEVIVGRDSAASLEQKYGVWRDPATQKRWEAVGRQMVAVSGRTGLNYHFGILNTKEINALAVPGGWVYATRGLMEEKLADDELAFVAGHEVAHIAKRHGVRQLEQGLGVSLALGLIFNRARTTQALVSDVLQLLLQSGYSREHEADADRTAVTFMLRTGHDPRGGVTFLKRLQGLQKSKPSQLDRWFATHPPIDKRIAALEGDIAEAQKQPVR